MNRLGQTNSGCICASARVFSLSGRYGAKGRAHAAPMELEGSVRRAWL